MHARVETCVQPTWAVFVLLCLIYTGVHTCDLPPFGSPHECAFNELVRLAFPVRRTRHAACVDLEKASSLLVEGKTKIPPGGKTQKQTPLTLCRVCLGDFPDEILSLIFSHVDTATLLGAVPNVCRGWRAACGDDVYGPKVRLELRSVRQVLRIRPECVGLWVAATVRRFAWVVDLDLSSAASRTVCWSAPGACSGSPA